MLYQELRVQSTMSTLHKVEMLKIMAIQDCVKNLYFVILHFMMINSGVWVSTFPFVSESLGRGLTHDGRTSNARGQYCVY